MNNRKIILIVIISLFLILLSQIIKTIIPIDREIIIIKDMISINYIKNTGAAFGIGSNNTLSFIIISLIVILLIIRFLIIQINNINVNELIALILILAGGISNLIDRIFMGYIVDYIDITLIINFPIFNLADIYITIGWIYFTIITIKKMG